MKTWMLTVLALSATLAACGGGEEPERVQAHDRRVASAAPLLDDEGLALPSDPAAVPADPAARTRTGRYASTAQAEALEAALRGGVIHVVLEGSDEAAADLAVMTAYGLQALHDLPDGTPVLVQGGDLRVAARVVDRLVAGGWPQVWLVTL